MKSQLLLFKKSYHLSEIAKKLEEASNKTLFVVNANKVLFGAISDGDIRRAILKSSSLILNINDIMSQEPYFIYNNTSIEHTNFLFENFNLKAIPIVNKNKKIISILSHTKFMKGKKKFTSTKLVKTDLVIMAGGKGARMSPFTSILPKPLIPIEGKPIIIKIIQNFLNFNINKIYISINKKSQILKSFLGNYSKNTFLIEEKKELGTVGALSLLKNKISKNFFLTNCDTLLKKNYLEIYDEHIKNDNILTIIVANFEHKIPYGVCELDSRSKELINLIEKPKSSVMVNTGVYLMSSKIINYIPKNKEFNIDELINKLIKNKIKIGVHPIKTNEWSDFGTWEKYKKFINE